MKLISIIIPTYNCGEYLPETIKSLQKQTYANWEAICVDDGSTDNLDDVLKKYDYSDNIMEVVLSHHECYDGSGYPNGLVGEDIPIGARILKVTDEFAALISDRPYRKAFDIDTAVSIMIDEVKNLDMKAFILFQRLIHEESTLELIKNSRIDIDDLDISDILDI